MIANEHFRWPPAIPTLPLGGHTAARPRKAKLHAKNRGGIDRYADRLAADGVGRVAITSGRRIVEAALTGSNRRSRLSNGGPK